MFETNPQETAPKPKSYFKIILIAVLLIALIVLLIQYRNSQRPGQKVKPGMDIKKFDTSRLPDAFPENMPLEAGAAITQNYNATDKDGRLQATREFITSKTLAENYKIYTDYFNKKGWTVLSKLDLENLKNLYAQQANQFASVAITKNSVNGNKVVLINVTIMPAPQTPSK